MEKPQKRRKKDDKGKKVEHYDDKVVTFASSSKEKSNLLIWESPNTLIGHNVSFTAARPSVFKKKNSQNKHTYREDIVRQEHRMVFIRDLGTTN